VTCEQVCCTQVAGWPTADRLQSQGASSKVCDLAPRHTDCTYTLEAATAGLSCPMDLGLKERRLQASCIWVRC
jgi:hypothetical protein